MSVEGLAILVGVGAFCLVVIVLVAVLQRRDWRDDDLLN
jgi:hypothetical protein